MRRALVPLLAAGAVLSGPAAAQAATAAKPPGELRVCGEGPVAMDVFIDRGELHKEKRELGAGKCKSFALPKGKYAVTVTARCLNNRDSRLADITVAPASRALYQDTALAGARVVRESTTTFTATWTCLGVDEGPEQPGPPAFGEPTPPPAS